MNMVVSAAAITAAGSSLIEASTPDPIFALIEAHKRAYLALEEALRLHGELESTIPRDKRRSIITVWDYKIVETDDPRWIESELEIRRLFENETDAAIAMVSCEGMTPNGAVALLQHVVEHEAPGNFWPDRLGCDDLKRDEDWEFFLHRAIYEAFTGRSAPPLAPAVRAA